MRVRRLSPILVAIAIAACTKPDVVTEERTDTLPTQLPAAELPTYAKGDRYIYDNPREAWTMTGDSVSSAASMIAWICSMLFTLKAPTPG